MDRSPQDTAPNLLFGFRLWSRLTAYPTQELCVDVRLMRGSSQPIIPSTNSLKPLPGLPPAKSDKRWGERNAVPSAQRQLFRDVSAFPDFVVLGFANDLIDFGHGVEAADWVFIE